MNALHDEPDAIHDVLGIGFGPSNLALAIAIAEHNAQAAPEERIRAEFLERQPRFGWHRGMLIDDATMQVSFLKDLVTMRNPTSDFSFLCFLRDRGRLVDFLNAKTLFPLRIEFHEYFEWAAGQVADQVTYDAEVVSVEPVLTEGGEVRWFDVVSRVPGRPERTVVRRARNISVAVGLEPHVPPGTALSDRIWHNSELVPRTRELSGTGASVDRILVLGAGQSGAEAVDFLHRSFPDTEVCAVFAKYGYTPADDSPFANRIFDPEAVDVYFRSRPEVKQSLYDYHRSTNYSVVDMDLIESLYATMYREKVQGNERLRMRNVSRIRDVEQLDDRLDVTVEYLPTGERRCSPATCSCTPPDTGPGTSTPCWAERRNSACATTTTPSGSAATTGSRRRPKSPPASTSRARPSTRTVSPRRCCRRPPFARERSSTPCSTVARSTRARALGNHLQLRVASPKF